MIEVMVNGKVPPAATRARIVRAVNEACAGARKRRTGSVSVSFIGDARMASLNRKWRGKPSTTDVLSFAPAGIPGPQASSDRGDIFISARTVARNARKQKISIREELLRVVIHGTLHLLGYDHATKRDASKMFRIQERALGKVLGSRPVSTTYFV